MNTRARKREKPTEIYLLDESIEEPNDFFVGRQSHKTWDQYHSMKGSFSAPLHLHPCRQPAAMAIRSVLFKKKRDEYYSYCSALSRIIAVGC